MQEPADVKSEAGERGNKFHGFKKKGSRFTGRKQQSTTADEFFRGVRFFVGREDPEMYLKTIERLGLYVSTQFKNGSDVKKCLKLGKIVKPVVPDLPEEHTAHEKRVWE